MREEEKKRFQNFENAIMSREPNLGVGVKLVFPGSPWQPWLVARKKRMTHAMVKNFNSVPPTQKTDIKN